MGRQRLYDYEALAERYVTTDLSYTAVAREYSVPESTVRRAVKVLGLCREQFCQCGKSIQGDVRKRYCDDCRVVISQVQKRQYYTANRERCLQRSAQWYLDNLDQFRTTNTAWHRANRERVNLAIRRWKVRNGGKLVQYAGSRRARLVDQFIEPVDPDIVYERHGGICGICRQPVGRDDLHIDHVIPISQGGMHGYSNVQPTHASCNLHKGAKIIGEQAL